MNLKIGGSNVGKIMYNGQEFGGSQMLESGTILLVLDEDINWAKRRFGLNFRILDYLDSITCKAIGVEKDWKNVSRILVEVDSLGVDKHTVIDISELKKGPQNVGDMIVTLEGKEFTFKNNGPEIRSITVEAYNE